MHRKKDNGIYIILYYKKTKWTFKNLSRALYIYISEFQIMTLSGSVLREYENKIPSQISLRDLPSGIYILKVIDIQSKPEYLPLIINR